jgi:uncharacterized SAM-binding protein YcdF (DUF218 family)
MSTRPVSQPAVFGLARRPSLCCGSVVLFWLAVLAFVAGAAHLRRERAREWKEQRVAIAGTATAAVVAVLAAPGLPVFAKMVGRLAMPLGMLWLAALIALPLVAARRRRAGVALGVMIAFFTAAGSEPLGAWLLAQLEADFVEREPFAEEPFEVVFVMGGGVHEGPVGPVLGPSGGRVVLAARLQREGIAERLVASGSHVPGLERGADGTRLTRELWEQLGVPAEAIDRVGPAYNSRQEIAAYAEYAEEHGLRRVGLLTSAWHLRRALRIAERHDFHPTPLAADFRGVPRWEGAFSVVPSGGGAQDVHQACWEFLGAATGR